jgi:hypothetical protein
MSNECEASDALTWWRLVCESELLFGEHVEDARGHCHLTVLVLKSQLGAARLLTIIMYSLKANYIMGLYLLYHQRPHASS